jgi:hypothetical protein
VDQLFRKSTVKDGLGYSTSDLFKLECSSDKLYEYLYKPDNWKPHQFTALLSLYKSTEPCLPRRVTLRHASFGTDSKLWRQLMEDRHINKLRDIEPPSEDEAKVVADKVKPTDKVSRYVSTDFGTINATDANWADSIYIRLFGVQGLTQRDPKIDRHDFLILIKQAKACRQREQDLREIYSILSIKEFYQSIKNEQASSGLESQLAGHHWLLLAQKADRLD